MKNFFILAILTTGCSFVFPIRWLNFPNSSPFSNILAPSLVWPKHNKVELPCALCRIDLSRAERLSIAVQKFSCLYDKSCKDYKDKTVKQNAWREVARETELETGKYLFKAYSDPNYEIQSRQGWFINSKIVREMNAGFVAYRNDIFKPDVNIVLPTEQSNTFSLAMFVEISVTKLFSYASW